MVKFLEQTVARQTSGRNNILYGLCWFLCIVLVICAAISASGILGADAAGGLSFNLMALIGTLVCIALAVLAFFGKDYLRMDYDYSITESIVEVSRVLNNKRRKLLAEFDIGKIIACGPAEGSSFAKMKAASNVTINKWYVHEDAKLYFFVYEDKGRRNLAVLEFNDEMINMIKTSRALQGGAWHRGEGKD